MGAYTIETHALVKCYGEQKSVHALDLHIRPGRIYGLLGRNEAARTTAMRMLLGLSQPTSAPRVISRWSRFFLSPSAQ